MKLSLRDLFWLVLVAALACAWWLDRRGRVPPNVKANDILTLLIESPRAARPPTILAVTVTGFDKDGTLVLRGDKKVFMDNRLVHRTQVHGKVRPGDVRADHTVQSRDVSDLTIETWEPDEAVD